MYMRKLLVGLSKKRKEGKMSKSVTVTVPDALHARMQAYKRKMNVSQVFQRALEQRIAEFEREDRQKGELDLEAIVERLRMQRDKMVDQWYQTGKRDGLWFAKRAHYSQLEVVATTQEQMRQDEKMQESLQNFEKKHGFLPWSDRYEAWEKGFINAVTDFWESIQEML